jgi:hypothetical protein
MSDNFDTKIDPVQPMVYQIRIKGHLDSQWKDWFGNLGITLEDNGNTLLTGPVVDQSALYGLLRKIRDLGLPLLSVNKVGSEHENALEDNRQQSDDVSEGELPIDKD